MRLQPFPALAALLTALAPAMAPAATMTFAYTDWEAFNDTYEEDGILAEATEGGHFGAYAEDVQHMDDMAADGPPTIQFRMWRQFDALSFDLLPVAFDYRLCNEETGVCTMST